MRISTLFLFSLSLVFSGCATAQSDKAGTEKTDTDPIAKTVADHRGDIRSCYEKGLLFENKDASGKVSVTFTIESDGAVSHASIKRSTLHHSKTEQCILDVIRGIEFPKVRDGGVATVTFPFVFKPKQ